MFVHGPYVLQLFLMSGSLYWLFLTVGFITFLCFEDAETQCFVSFRCNGDLLILLRRF